MMQSTGDDGTSGKAAADGGAATAAAPGSPTRGAGQSKKMHEGSRWPIKPPNDTTKMSVVEVTSTAVGVKEAFGSFRAYKKKREEVSSIRKSVSEPDLAPDTARHGDSIRRRRTSSTSDTLRAIVATGKEVAKKAAESKVHLLAEDDMTGKAEQTELYFDLIFVAAMFRLGNMVAYQLAHSPDDQAYVFDSVILFLVLWLTWHHVNMLLTRFKLEPPWDLVGSLNMIMALLLAITLIDYKAVETGSCTDLTASTNQTQYEYEVVSALATRRFTLVWAASRAVYAMIYAVGAAFNKNARRMSGIYIISLMCIVMLLGIAAAVDTREVYSSISCVVVCMEIGMYAVALILTPVESRLPIDVSHCVERAELWAILVIGETMISLVHGAEEKYQYADSGYFLNAILCFCINYMLLQMYLRSQPPEEHDGNPEMDSHAMDISLFRSIMFDVSQAVVTAGLFSYGVAVKFVMKYGHYKDGSKYHQDYAWMFSFGVALSLFTMTLSRYIHEWTNYHVVKTRIKRKTWWILNFAAAALIMCLPLFTVATEPDRKDGYSYYTYKRTGLATSEFLGCVFACIFVIDVLDVVASLQPAEVKKMLIDFRTATQKLRNGEVPSDFDAVAVDKVKMTRTITLAMAVQKIRGQGTKAMRFSDLIMQKVLEKRLKEKEEGERGQSGGLEPAAGAGQDGDKAKVPRSTGLFAMYQEEVDKENPNHVLGSKNLAMRKWRVAKAKISLQRAIRKGTLFSMVGRGAGSELSLSPTAETDEAADGGQGQRAEDSLPGMPVDSTVIDIEGQVLAPSPAAASADTGTDVGQSLPALAAATPAPAAPPSPSLSQRSQASTGTLTLAEPAEPATGLGSRNKVAPA